MSLAVCKAGAVEKGVPLYRHIADLAGNAEVILPVPVSGFFGRPTCGIQCLLSHGDPRRPSSKPYPGATPAPAWEPVLGFWASLLPSPELWTEGE